MIYVLSDIHGNSRRFHSILEQIGLRPEDTLYILGDAIDRHPYGIEILREIIAAPNMKMLLGNHEYMMLRAMGVPYDGPEDIKLENPGHLLDLWYRNGGEVTRHYLLNQRKAVRAEIFDYLRALPLNIDISVDGREYRLIHAAPVERYDALNIQEDTRTRFAVWDRQALFMSPVVGQTTIIFGHTPTVHFQENDPLAIWRGESLIGIDCGSGYPEPELLDKCDVHGRLACLRLDDMREYYSEETE